MKKNRSKVLMAGVLAVMIGTRSVSALSEDTAAGISSALTLVEQDMDANGTAIRLILEKCINALQQDDPAAGTLKSILVLLDAGNANPESVSVLLRSLIEENSQEEKEENPEVTQETYKTDGSGRPAYRTEAFITTIVPSSLLLEMPRDWGNNASGRSLTSYSPVNESGAISPQAGTLTVSYFPFEEPTDEQAFDAYVNSIEKMSVTADVKDEDVTAADLPARKVDFIMNVGANQFTCETVCMAHEGTMYTVELLQGQLSEYDYFPLYGDIINTAKIGSREQIEEASVRIEKEKEEAALQKEAEEQIPEEPLPAQDEPVPVQDEPVPAQDEPVPAQEDSSPAPDTPENSPDIPVPDVPSVSAETFPEDASTFMYSINGHVYQFPTAVSALASDDLPLDRSLVLPYDLHSDADMNGGKWAEISNTQYYYFENTMSREMAGVTNLSGSPVSMNEGILTALIDTGGSNVQVMLPGGIHVGGNESDIIKGFREFGIIPMDGNSYFRGNEVLFACNVRDDGCIGYAVVRNDAPYYSAVSMICEEGLIKEICFECLGSVRANGVFL